MKILDVNNKEIQNPDLGKGCLTIETIVVEHHDAVEAKAGKSHIEVIKNYDNGGKDVITIWDEEPVEAKEAYDETEKIQRYHSYTEDELLKISKAKEESENRQKKLDSIYSADMTFGDVVDTIAEIQFGGTK